MQDHINFRIDSLTRAERPGWTSLVFGTSGNAAAGWDARVTVLDGPRAVGTLHLDRLDGEDGWHVSAEFRAGSSMPRFMLGLFSRSTRPVMAGPDLTFALDNEAAAETVPV